MTASVLSEILSGLKSHEVVPYLGPGALEGVVNPLSKNPIPADSDSLIYAMNDGKAMAPRLMYEFPRAAMNLENKKGRKFIERFLTTTYADTKWTESEFHQWVADQSLPYVIDCNRDIQLQTMYAGRAHTLVVGAARIAATPYRFDLFEWQQDKYVKIDLGQVKADLPVLFKPLGTPLPTPSFVASDADFVDYITELMGGFAIPSWLKTYRKDKRYVFLGMRFNRDTDRMIMSDMIYSSAKPAGWALIKEPTEKEMRYCSKKNIEIIEADWRDLMAAHAEVEEHVA